jgi:hypothetical protein
MCEYETKKTFLPAAEKKKEKEGEKKRRIED